MVVREGSPGMVPVVVDEKHVNKNNWFVMCQLGLGLATKGIIKH